MCQTGLHTKRESVLGPLKGGRHSLSDVNGETQEVGNTGRVRRGLQERCELKKKRKRQQLPLCDKLFVAPCQQIWRYRLLPHSALCLISMGKNACLEILPVYLVVN